MKHHLDDQILRLDILRNQLILDIERMRESFKKLNEIVEKYRIKANGTD